MKFLPAGIIYEREGFATNRAYGPAGERKSRLNRAERISQYEAISDDISLYVSGGSIEMTVSSAVAETISVIDEDNVNLDVEIDYSAVDYVMLISENAGNTLTVHSEYEDSPMSGITLYWSHDNITYNEISLGTSINFSEDKKLYLRGYSSTRSLYDNGNSCFFTIPNNVNILGNIMALLDWEHPNNTLLGERAFAMLFGKHMERDYCHIVDASKLCLKAISLSNYCYASMFNSCESLQIPPALPATSLSTGCYSNMFSDSGIRVAPELSATILAGSCYKGMFKGCCNLTNGPTLPAATLAPNCYEEMFKDSHVNYITCLATDISANKCIYKMFYETYSSGTLIKSPSIEWPVINEGNEEYDGVPSNWTVQNYSE